MAEYIDKQAFLEEQRHLYCENCEKRKGIKRGKMRFVYEIGDAPCRSCGYGDVLDDLEDLPAADVRPVRRGKWSIVYDDFMKSHYDTCSCCGKEYFGANGFNFCPNCGCVMEDT